MPVSRPLAMGQSLARSGGEVRAIRHDGRMAHPRPEIVNPIDAAEIPAWASTMAVAFHRDAADPEVVRRHALLRSVWDPDRAWGARDRDRWVATLRTEPRTLTVPGSGDGTSVIPVDAVTNVTVAATHHRRGLMSAMLGASLQAARERGDAVSILIAAEWPIYGRFGYAPATLAAEYTLRRARPGATVPGDLGRVRTVDRAEFRAVAPAVFDAARRRNPGQIDRDHGWFDRVLGLESTDSSPSAPANLLVHDGDDGPDGILGWDPGESFGLVPPFGHLRASWLSAATDTAYRDLWAYLGAIDLVEEIRLTERPVDEPARWLLPDARTLVTSAQYDFLWVRLLDVPAALSARRYACSGELVLEVTDDDTGGSAAGRYHLRADADGAAACTPTDAAPDLTLPQRALASTYLGGFTLDALSVTGAVTEHRKRARARFDAMFASARAPWCATWF